MTGEKSLWGDVLVGKYGREGWGQGKISVNNNDSSLWKAITKCWDSLELHRCWAIGDGSRIRFWSDKWIDESTRLNELQVVIPETTCQWKVQDVVTTNGEWNFNMIRSVVPNIVVKRLHDIVPPHPSQGEDTPLWLGMNNGQVTVSAAYHLITGDIVKENDKKWNQIWRIDSIERIRVFIWQLTHDKLLTKARLAKWHLGDALCYNCGHFEETTLHVVRDCKVAVDIWRYLLTNQERSQFFMVGFHEWITMNLNNFFGKKHGNDWRAIWATTCYLMWQWRNKSMHDTKFVSPEQPWKVIVEYVKAYKLNMVVEEQARTERAQQQILVAWLPPLSGWVALNSDGAAKINDKTARCDGVLRDERGRWLDGFVKALGDTTTYMAELWGIYEGLKLAKQRGTMRIEVRTNSQVIAQSLKERRKGSRMGCTLMQKVRSLLDGNWEVNINHVFQETNRCVDMLANMGCDDTNGIEFFKNPPSRVVQIVADDIRGVSFARLISL
jgi:ribonuclease HI